MALTIAGAGCSNSEAERFVPAPGDLPAEKTTCDEMVATVLPEGMHLVDRNLIPYSKAVLAVEAEYEGGGRNLSLVSGGYLDDIMEAYDDLSPTEIRDVLGIKAGLLTGDYLEFSIRAAVLPDDEAVEPCGTRAVIGVGFTEDGFDSVLRGLTLRHHD